MEYDPRNKAFHSDNVAKRSAKVATQFSARVSLCHIVLRKMIEMVQWLFHEMWKHRTRLSPKAKKTGLLKAYSQ